MSSRAQKKANRANARKSSGPRTVQGKAAAAQNARRHGLAGGFAILAYEDADEFQRLLAGYVEEFAPSTALERCLVEQMAKAQWTLARAGRIEACVISYMGGCRQDDSPDFEVAMDIVNGSKDPILTVERYRAAAERTLHRSSREIRQLRAARERENRVVHGGAVRQQPTFYQQDTADHRPLRNEPNSHCRPTGDPRGAAPFGTANRGVQPANVDRNRPYGEDAADENASPFPNAFRSLAREALDRAERERLLKR